MPLDFITHGTYWVVGSYALVPTGTIAFGFVGMMYYIFHITGRMYSEKWASIQFILMMWGTVQVFFTQHILGLEGMARRSI